MRPLIITAVLFLHAMNAITAQTLSPATFVTQGSFLSGSGPNLSSTIGQPISATLNSASHKLSQGIGQPEIEIRCVLPSNTYCAGGSFPLPYLPFGYIDPTNAFTAQLSNASGNFSSPVNIGSVQATNAGSIICQLPGIIPTGTGYRVRVIGSHPNYHGKDNGSNISIGSLSISGVGVAMSPNPVLTGQALNTLYTGIGPRSVTLSASGLTGPGTRTYNWSASVNPLSITSGQGTTSIIVSPTISTTYTLTITDINGCTLLPKPTFIVNVLNITSTTNPNKIYVCHNGTSLEVSINSAMAHINHGDRLGTCPTLLRSLFSDVETESEPGIRMMISPNPTTTAFSVSMESSLNDEIIMRVFDVTGKTILSKNNLVAGQVFKIGNEFPAGYYLIEMRQGSITKTMKLIKQ